MLASHQRIAVTCALYLASSANAFCGTQSIMLSSSHAGCVRVQVAVQHVAVQETTEKGTFLCSVLLYSMHPANNWLPHKHLKLNRVHNGCQSEREHQSKLKRSHDDIARNRPNQVRVNLEMRQETGRPQGSNALSECDSL